MAIKLNGFWKKSKAGQEVAQVEYSTHPLEGVFNSRIKVGDEVEVNGRIFTLEAVGNPFKVEKDKWVYLYPTTPQKRQPAFTGGREEIPDDPMDRMEQEAQRELGHTGELPGA